VQIQQRNGICRFCRLAGQQRPRTFASGVTGGQHQGSSRSRWFRQISLFALALIKDYRFFNRSRSTLPRMLRVAARVRFSKFSPSYLTSMPWSGRSPEDFHRGFNHPHAQCPPFFAFCNLAQLLGWSRLTNGFAARCFRAELNLGGFLQVARNAGGVLMIHRKGTCPVVALITVGPKGTWPSCRCLGVKRLTGIP